jgi:hypothetical protein
MYHGEVRDQVATDQLVFLRQWLAPNSG